jgi:hypothetical protein
MAPAPKELIVEEVGGKPQLGALARSPFERPKLVGQETSWFEKDGDRTM